MKPTNEIYNFPGLKYGQLQLSIFPLLNIVYVIHLSSYTKNTKEINPNRKLVTFHRNEEKIQYKVTTFYA